MSDIYRIAVSLTMQSNAPAFFASLAQSVLHVHADVRALQGSLNTLNRTKLAIGGGLAIAGGMAIFKGLDKIAEHGTEILDQQDKLIRQNVSHAKVAEMTAEAYEKIGKAIPTATAADYLRTVNQLKAVTGGWDDARAAAPFALKSEALLANLTGQSAEGSGHALYRALEMRGLTVGDDANKEKGQKLGEAYMKDIAGSGGKLTANDFALMAMRGGATYKKMSPEFLAGPMAVLAGDMTGNTAGTTLSTFGQFLTGATQMSQAQLGVLSKLHMIDQSKVHKAKGGTYTTDPGAIHGALEHSDNYFDWVQKSLIPAFEKAHIGEGPERDSMMGKLGRNKNTTRMLTMFSDPEFLQQITKDIENWKQSMGVNQAYDSYTKNDPKGVKEGFNKQYDSMMGAIGAPLMQAAIPVMKAITDVFTKLGALANANPAVITGIGAALAGLGVAMTTAGIGMLLAAIGPAGWLIGGLVALGAALTAWKPDAMKKIATGILDGWNAIAHLDWKGLVAALGKEISGAFDLLPDGVKAKIVAGMEAIKFVFCAQIDALVGAVKGALGSLSGIGSSIVGGAKNLLGKAEGLFHTNAYHGGGGGGLGAQTISDRVRSNMAPKASQITAQNTVNVHLDGEKIAKVVTKNQVAAMEYPNAIGGHDGYSSYYPAGGTAMPA